MMVSAAKSFRLAERKPHHDFLPVDYRTKRGPWLEVGFGDRARFFATNCLCSGATARSSTAWSDSGVISRSWTAAATRASHQSSAHPMKDAGAPT
jgi:hypothetical protein